MAEVQDTGRKEREKHGAAHHGYKRGMKDEDDGGRMQSGSADEDALRDASVVPDLEVQCMGVSGAGPALRGAATRLPRVPPFLLHISRFLDD